MERSEKLPLLVIVGPTSVGKTTLSLELASEFEGEIISADSRLLYRGLDIGTDKPSPAAQARIPHHLIDLCSPDEILTLGEYQQLAYKATQEVHTRGRLPLLVGGTGQYVKAVIEGWTIPKVPPDEELREALTDLGGPEVARWLECLDPVASGRIDHRNVRRVVRALEVTLLTGRPISDQQHKDPPDYAIKIIGLTCEREDLYERIDARVEEMISNGLLKEVQCLKDSGYGSELPSMSGLGYRQLYAYLEGACSLDEAIERIKFETHRFARQQYTWFRPGKGDIDWFNVQQAAWQLLATHCVREWLETIGQ
jgi:tRNA dimethylallyltransferase